MDDQNIVALYWKRSQRAVEETASKYGGYCYSIAYNILNNNEDAEECVNDTYMDAWNSIPPHRPAILSTFLGKITRRVAIDKWRKSNAQKRGDGEVPLVLEELGECVASVQNVEHTIEHRLLSEVIKDFVKKLPETERSVFVCRYWYMDSIEDIGKQFHFSQSKVKSMLLRTRKKLWNKLNKEGFV